MGRKSSVARLEPAARKYLEKLLREDRHTLDELLAALRAKFPTADVSRSGLHRYRASLEEMMGRMREIDTAATALVSELGEGVGVDLVGQLLQGVGILAAFFQGFALVYAVAITGNAGGHGQHQARQCSGGGAHRPGPHCR